MKTVVVGIKGRYAMLLRDDGVFARVKNQNYSIGQVVIMKNQFITAKIVGGAAAVAAVFMLSLGAWAYGTPYAYVSLDVNPSVEYTLNRFDRVLTVKAVNDDGQEIIRQAELGNLKNKTIDEAIAQTVKQINEQGYFQGEGAIVIAASAKDIKKAEALATRLKEEAGKEAEEQGKDVDIEAIGVGRERVEEAHKLGVTPGRLNLVEKLRDSFDEGDKFNMEEWLQKPVKEIMQATKENREESKEQAKAEKQEQKEEAQSQQKEEAQSQQKEEAQSQQKGEAQSKESSKAVGKQEKDQPKVESKADEKEIEAQQKAKKEAVKAQEKEARDKAKAESKANNANDKK